MLKNLQRYRFRDINPNQFQIDTRYRLLLLFIELLLFIKYFISFK